MNDVSLPPIEPLGTEIQTPPSLPVAQRLGPFFDHTDWLSFGVATAVALAVNLFTLAPEVTLEYSGILTTGAWYGGVPHPPGYPLWTIYAWLFTVLLPFSNIAWRVAVSSAVAGALACGLVALLASRTAGAVVAGLAGLRRLDLKTENALRLVSGVSAGLALGFDSAFWETAVVVEVWALSVFLLAVTFCLLMRWFYRPNERRYLYLGSLAYGLTLSNSEALAVVALGLFVIILIGDRPVGRDVFLAATLLIAGILVYNFGIHHGIWDRVEVSKPIWRVWFYVGVVTALVTLGVSLMTRRLLTEWKAVLVSGCLLALGLSWYLYPALASMTNPPMNWGYPRTVEGFVHVLSRGQYEAISPTRNLWQFVEQVGLYGQLAVDDFGLQYLLAAVVPFCFLHRMHAQARGWMLGLLAAYLCLSLFLLAMVNPSSDRSSLDLVKDYFAPSHLVLAVWAGCGLTLAGTFLARPRLSSGRTTTIP